MSDDRRRSRPGRSIRRRIVRRSIFLQAVWNYETLQAIGFAWALLPGLERLYPDREERSRRLRSYLEPFNSNPYLATLGLGLALRMESEVARGAVGAETRLARLLRALRGSLGAVGDELFWAGWRPALGVVAALVALWTHSVWPAIGFLVAYNVVAQGVRVDGVSSGYATGAGIARVFQRPFWRRATRAAGRVGAFGAGAGLGAGIVSSVVGGGPSGAAVFFALVGLLWVVEGARRRRRPLSPSLAFLLALILLALLSSVYPGVTPP